MQSITPTTPTPTTLNGVDTPALKGAIEAVAQDPALGMTTWNVRTHWKGGFRSDTKVSNFTIGGKTVEKDFTVKIDEPLELCGTNRFANPQEYLMAALNACMMVGYVALCSLEGIELEEVRIETEGDIDLRGFFGLDPEVKPGYDEMAYRVYIRGNGTREQFERIHEVVVATSPNRFNIANAIRLKSRLIVA